MCGGNCTCKIKEECTWTCTNCENDYNKDVNECPNCGTKQNSFADMCDAMDRMLEGTICDLMFVGEYEDKLRIELKANIDSDCMWNWECISCGNKYDYAVEVCPNCEIESPSIKVDKVISFINLVLTIDGLYDIFDVEYIGNNIYLTYKKC